MTIHELEAQLERYLGFPTPAAGPERRVMNRQPLLAMRTQIRSMRWHAEQIGKLPEGYPFYVHAIIKVVSSLLPWYTRPLRQFGAHTTATLESMAVVVEEIVKYQEQESQEPGAASGLAASKRTG